MLKKTGYQEKEIVKKEFPPLKHLKKGPKAFIECYQKIPCNPCTTSCPHDAITIKGDIINRPKLDLAKCVGCGICVYNCPGLAIMVVGQADNPDYKTFDIPYEFYPLPNKGDRVLGLNRKGEELGMFTVLRVLNNKRQDKTALVRVKVPNEFLYDFATIKVGEDNE
ncbi:MAG: 4Fe-4S binding protein [Candidatus Izimaplasma sp.]|nr:4Fe-4S binding protein [Candidatus Izimaplasma bacterium]